MKTRKAQLVSVVVLLTVIVASMLLLSCSTAGKAPCPAYRRVSVQ
ncbi:MAG: hypothetical protein ACTTKF_03495 [Bacteroides sp.]|jgi:hypothetical protein